MTRCHWNALCKEPKFWGKKRLEVLHGGFAFFPMEGKGMKENTMKKVAKTMAMNAKVMKK